MMYINFNYINNENIKLVEDLLNLHNLKGVTITLKDKVYEMIEEISEIVPIDIGELIVDVTGFNAMQMVQFNAVYTALNSVGYDVQVVVNNNGLIEELTYYYDFNGLVGAIDPNDFIETLKSIENLP